jgi:hypothetical protein
LTFTGIVPLNSGMMNAKITPNLLSFITVRRGDWVLKISVFKTKHVLLVAQNYYATEQIIIKHFKHHDEAANFIDNLIEE